MQVEVIYALPERACCLKLELPVGGTVADALEVAQGSAVFHSIDLTTHAVGIFGRLVQHSQPVNEGDRIEIYRALHTDPKTERRSRVADARRRARQSGTSTG